MDLTNIRPAKGSVKNEKRIGRGQGSGTGGTSTRGHKGAKSRSGSKLKIGFEGGQMPLHRRVPKFGFKNMNRVSYKALNLDAIQTLADTLNISTIDPQIMYEHGLIGRNSLVKVLGRGTVSKALEITANAFSAQAKSQIESAGGTATII